MKYAVEMGSGSMICIPSLINIASDIRRLMGEDTQDTQTGWRLRKPNLGT
jgi:hypothetical protein